MSILLDALKKSEAQRQLGETPTLRTPVPEDDPGADQDHTWVPAAMIVLTLGIITWIGLQQFSRDGVVLEPVAQTTNETGAAVVSAPESKGAEENPGRTATTPVKDFQAEEGLQASRSVPESRKDEAFARIRQSTGTAAPDESRDAAPESSVADAQALDSDPDSPPAPPQEQLINPYESEILSYWQIPQALRETMPEMHITVLVFAAKPEDRFVLIDGERLRENEELSSGLLLEEIQNDRAIFTYKNYRFHVKS